jgi:predicted dehydrogenase
MVRLRRGAPLRPLLTLSFEHYAKDSHMTRREFATAAVAASALSYSRILGANDRISLGFIGLGNRGDQVLEAFLEHGDSEISALCDLRQDYMDFASQRAANRGSRTQYKDYRKLLEDKSLNAVVISTPDHWHALMTIDACRAGHDVYVEKPLSLTVVEGRKMVEAVRKYGRVCQAGTQRRSLPWCKEAAARVREGGIGHVSVADCFNIKNEWPAGIGEPANSTPPPGVDYEMWLGPAPAMPYNLNRTFYKFRWFWHYSGGQVTNWGVHLMDMVQWSLGKHAPKAVTAMGGNYAVEDNREVPDTARVIWEYEGGTLAGFNQYNGNGAPTSRGQELELRGTKGTLYLKSRGYEIEPEMINEHGWFQRTPLDRETERKWRADNKAVIEPVSAEGPSGTEPHTRNFLDCVKSRERCNADVEIGHRSTSTPLIGNIALRVRGYLEWDAQAERFTNNEEANSYLHYEYRKPWKLEV